MNAHVYNRGQMVIPARARKEARIGEGDVVQVRIEGDGRILLVRLDLPKEPEPAKVKITRRKGSHAVATAGRPISTEEVKALLADFP